ncbi:MAG: hypothetical protein JNG88_17880, partial [Phycisphaerales bacterium]|nr:hypothetical protein [Phycisphaerales bacterium]
WTQWTNASGNTEFFLINAFLARYERRAFEIVNPPWATPTGAWRCADISQNDDAQRLTHTGYLHAAPNTWLFSSMNVNENANRTTVWSDTLPGWETRNDRLGWRRLEQIERPAEIVSLTDNVNFYVPGHGHRDARESAGRSREVIEDQAVPGPDGDNRGSHRTLGRRPATMIDGHAEALPIRGAYWMDLAGEFRLAESSGGAISLYRSEVRHFLWFVRGDDAVADGGGD